MSVLNEVINQFAFKGELENCEIFGSGPYKYNLSCHI